MDFVAVLRNPDIALDEEQNRMVRRRQTVERLILFGLLLVSFLSQLVLHVQVQDLRADLNTEKQKIEDIVAAKEIIFNYHSVETFALTEKSENDNSRVQRTVTPHYPHFELTGAGRSESGVFLWNTRNLGRGFRLISSNGNAKEIQILETGMYRIHAKVAINGRNIQTRYRIQINPAVGLFLMKRKPTTPPAVIDRAWKTQDQRGTARYLGADAREPMENQASKSYPLDTIEVGGGYLLEANDRIYVQRALDMVNDPYNERFLNNDEYARFEAFRYA